MVLLCAATSIGRLRDSVCETDATTLYATSVTLRPLLDGEVDQLVAILARPGMCEWWGLRDDSEHEGLRNGGAVFAIQVEGALAGWLGYNEEFDPDRRDENSFAL
jgi:hypothetical protein